MAFEGSRNTNVVARGTIYRMYFVGVTGRGSCAKAVHRIANEHACVANRGTTGGIAMLSGGAFNDEEMQRLRSLPAVANVTRDRITYSDTFKQMCTIRYLAGESPTKIFREAGLSPDLVGRRRIERCVARWKANAIRSVRNGDDMSDSEILARLAERYKNALVMKRNLASITSAVSDSDTAATVQSDDNAVRSISLGVFDRDTVVIIIRQQARRINELERYNAALRNRLNEAAARRS